MPGPRDPGILLPEDRRVRQGAWLLIASLAVFFFSSLLLYAFYIYVRVRDRGDDLTSFDVPKSFWFSTAILVGLSWSLQQSVSYAKSNATTALIKVLSVAFVLSLAFFLVQGEGLYQLIERMRTADRERLNLHTMTLVLAVIHALHCVGGVVAIVWVLVKSFQRQYDHERYYGLQFCALYWHFLDIVWLCLLASFHLGSYFINQSI